MDHFEAIAGVQEHLEPYAFGSLQFFRNAIKITLADEFGKEQIEFSVMMESLTPELRTVIYKVHIALAQELRVRGYMDDLSDLMMTEGTEQWTVGHSISNKAYTRGKQEKRLKELLEESAKETKQMMQEVDEEETELKDDAATGTS